MRTDELWIEIERGWEPRWEVFLYRYPGPKGVGVQNICVYTSTRKRDAGGYAKRLAKLLDCKWSYR